MSGCEIKYKQYVAGKTANFHSLSWFLILFEVSQRSTHKLNINYNFNYFIVQFNYSLLAL